MNDKINMTFEEFVKYATEKNDNFGLMRGNGIEWDATDPLILAKNPRTMSMTLFVQFYNDDGELIHSSINSSEVLEEWDYEELVGDWEAFDTEEDYEDAIKEKQKEYEELLNKKLTEQEDDLKSDLWETLYDLAEKLDDNR